MWSSTQTHKQDLEEFQVEGTTLSKVWSPGCGVSLRGPLRVDNRLPQSPEMWPSGLDSCWVLPRSNSGRTSSLRTL